MSGGRLPKRIMFGNFEGVVWRDGKEKEWMVAYRATSGRLA